MTDYSTIRFMAISPKSSPRSIYEAGMITGTVFEHLINDAIGINESQDGSEEVLKLRTAEGYDVALVERFLRSMQTHGLPFSYSVQQDVVCIKHGSLAVTLRMNDHAQKALFGSPKLLNRINKKSSLVTGAPKMTTEPPPHGFVLVEKYVPPTNLFFVKI